MSTTRMLESSQITKISCPLAVKKACWAGEGNTRARRFGQKETARGQGGQETRRHHAVMWIFAPCLNEVGQTRGGVVLREMVFGEINRRATGPEHFLGFAFLCILAQHHFVPLRGDRTFAGLPFLHQQ